MTKIGPWILKPLISRNPNPCKIFTDEINFFIFMFRLHQSLYLLLLAYGLLPCKLFIARIKNDSAPDGITENNITWWLSYLIGQLLVDWWMRPMTWLLLVAVDQSAGPHCCQCCWACRSVVDKRAVDRSTRVLETHCRGPPHEFLTPGSVWRATLSWGWCCNRYRIYTFCASFWWGLLFVVLPWRWGLFFWWW